MIYKNRLEISDLEWSPDGERIAFLAGEVLFVMDAAGGEPEQLARLFAFRENIAWSPDGKTIAYSEHPSVYTFDVDDPKPQVFAENAYAPDWSPDGKHLAYYLDDEEAGYPIVMTPIGGGDAERVPAKTKHLYSFETNLDWLHCRT